MASCRATEYINGMSPSPALQRTYDAGASQPWTSSAAVTPSTHGTHAASGMHKLHHVCILYEARTVLKVLICFAESLLGL